ncbi:MAG TPA: M28 family peptidase, partial [Acidobacteriota bacterium]|nr:M28 family peptidase [Acidobacteriota bacterium]
RLEPANIVFAGYGMAAPAVDGQEEYDSYAHLDVEGKWALILRFLPEDVTPERRQHLARFASLRYKAMAARERGAVGIIVVSGPRSGVRNELIELTLDSSLGGSSLGAVSISDSVGKRLVASSSKDLEELQRALDSGRPQMGFELGGVKVKAIIDVVRQKGVAYNVAARLAGSRSDLPAVFVGAHYDHLGRGEAGTSLASDREERPVHYGADDNASGVAAVLEIARFLAAGSRQGEALQRDVVFGFWSGEEIGLLGSSHFASNSMAGSNSRDRSSQAQAYLNLDMVGRLRDSLVVQGVGSSSVWPAEIERRNVPVGLPLTLQREAYLPTDATSFYLRKVPVLSFFTGAHEEYHTPEDAADTLNYEGMEKISRLAALLTRSLANRREDLDFQEMQRPERMGQRAMLRAFLGTIPDYAQGDVLGVRLSGVIQNGPAQKAGIRAGDIIVELAGRSIENIYDYTFAIEGLKIGESVRIVVLREGDTLQFELVPESRQ